MAIETSGRDGSVALIVDGRAVAEERFPHGLQHAAAIIPRIDGLCRQQAWSPADIREVYVSTGPGSFTGLRIGVTLAKTLALATGAKLVAVPSALVLAHNAPADAQRVLIVLDAKRDHIFTARLEKRADRGWVFEEEPHLDSLTAALARSPRPVYLVGEGIAHHQKSIPADDAGIFVADAASCIARAAVTGQIGHVMARDGIFTPADDLLPVYLRKPEAEEKWEALHRGR